MKSANYKRNMYGFYIDDCCVTKKNSFHFAAGNEAERDENDFTTEYNVTKRFVVAKELSKGDGFEFCGHVEFTNGSFKGMVARHGSGENVDVVYINKGGGVYSVTTKRENEIMKSLVGKYGPGLSWETTFDPTFSRVKTIGGKLYVCGPNNTVVRRLGKDAWEYIGRQEPDTDDGKILRNRHLRDIDGFADDDIYAVAYDGYIWHYDGKNWRQLGFPTNRDLNSVCCAGNGKVYVGTEEGGLFCGRDEKWDIVSPIGSNFSYYEDIVWFEPEQALYMTLERTGLHRIYKNRLESPIWLADEILICAQYLSVGDGVMLMAGSEGAVYHDGGQWNILYHKYVMDTIIKEENK